MAGSSEAQHYIPDFLGGDLSEKEMAAFKEGHDADITSSQTVLRREQRQDHGKQSNGIGKEVDVGKQDAIDSSEVSSIKEDAVINDLEKRKPVASSNEEEADPNIVSWDGPDDPANPVNFSASLKWGNIAVLSMFSTLTPLASSMFAPGVPQLMEEFHSDSKTLATFVVSVYIVGFALGPLVIAPLSEIYGRLAISHICNAGFICFTVACALASDLNMFIGFRFLQGCWGIAPLTVGGGTIADLMVQEKRGGAMAIWAMGPILGPVIGPVCGGFLAQAKGWRWIFWVLAIVTGATAIIAIFVLRETYAPTLLERKTRRLQKETGNMNLRSELDLGLSSRDRFVRAIVRPTKLMFLSPICALMSLYMAVLYGVMYLLFTTFTFVFEETYGFSESNAGLTYIGVGVGSLVGIAFAGALSDRILKRLAAKNGNEMKPEYRLPLSIYAGPLVPIGLFLYGWTAQYQIQWAVPLLGTLLFGMGLIIAGMCVNTYLVDTFTLYSASAIAANTVLRSLFGATFPLFGLHMYDAIGLGWGNSLLAFIGLAICLIPWLFYRYGEMIRMHPKFQVKI